MGMIHEPLFLVRRMFNPTRIIEAVLIASVVPLEFYFAGSWENRLL